MSGMNISDRTAEREYDHHSYTGHKGAYFGPGMEFEPILDSDYIDSAWSNPHGCKLVKSHEWAYDLNQIRTKFSNDWIIMIYRPDMSSYAWWHEAGGFQIKYPKTQPFVSALLVQYHPKAYEEYLQLWLLFVLGTLRQSSVFLQTINTILFSNGRTSINEISTAHINQVIKPTNVCVMNMPADNSIIVLFLLIAVYN